MRASTSSLSVARFVENVRVLAPVAGRVQTVERLPDGRSGLYVRLLEDGGGDVTVAGPRTRALFKDTTGMKRTVVVQFRPGWLAPLLGVSAHVLTDRYVKLQDLWGASGADLSNELLAARSVTEILDGFSRALDARRTFDPASAWLARRAIRLLEGDEVRVESVASRLGVTARHLRRAFTEAVGVGPKDFARTIRLERAVRMTATSRDWARIAAEAGYYDQSHLIADFRELVGLTPSAFVGREVSVR